MSETVVNETFSDNGRINVKEYFFKVLKYSDNLQKEVIIDEINDDSFGAEFFNINELSKKELSAIAIMELEKLGYKLN